MAAIVPCKYIRQFLPPAKENRPIKAKQKICMCERAKMFPRNWQGKKSMSERVRAANARSVCPLGQKSLGPLICLQLHGRFRVFVRFKYSAALCAPADERG